MQSKASIRPPIISVEISAINVRMNAATRRFTQKTKIVISFLLSDLVIGNIIPIFVHLPEYTDKLKRKLDKLSKPTEHHHAPFHNTALQLNKACQCQQHILQALSPDTHHIYHENDLYR
jgi:hypothetical protein